VASHDTAHFLDLATAVDVDESSVLSTTAVARAAAVTTAALALNGGSKNGGGGGDGGVENNGNNGHHGSVGSDGVSLSSMSRARANGEALSLHSLRALSLAVTTAVESGLTAKEPRLPHAHSSDDDDDDDDDDEDDDDDDDGEDDSVRENIIRDMRRSSAAGIGGDGDNDDDGDGDGDGDGGDDYFGIEFAMMKFDDAIPSAARQHPQLMRGEIGF
jgi:hypothetical protein